MNKIFAEDFYDWHPTTLMAVDSVDGTTITLYSQINYEKEELSYTVYDTSDEGVAYSNFDALDDAVNCYNERLRINTNCL